MNNGISSFKFQFRKHICNKIKEKNKLIYIIKYYKVTKRNIFMTYLDKILVIYLIRQINCKKVMMNSFT